MDNKSRITEFNEESLGDQIVIDSLQVESFDMLISELARIIEFQKESKITCSVQEIIIRQS